MRNPEAECIQSGHSWAYSKPHVGVRIFSTKYDKTSVLSHIIIGLTDTTQFSATHFRNVCNHFNGIIVKCLGTEMSLEKKKNAINNICYKIT